MFAHGPENTTPHATRRPPRWRHSLHFTFLIGQLVLLALVVSITIAVILVVERRFLVEQGQDLAEQLGNRVVSELRTEVSMAEALTTSLANFGETVAPDVGVYRRSVSHLLDYEGEESFIAGGGLWPEPGKFTPGLERRSFFWGRDAAGDLAYYDDYNDPDGPGYHHEEWYVPATFCGPGQAFWSKSYVDPYSLQPMVTCTVPMRRDGELLGVATVDLKLEGLDAFFAESSKVVGGYIFAVDRNNKLLSFPDAKLAKRATSGTEVPEFRNLRDLADEMPGYRKIADQLDAINETLIERAESRGVFQAAMADTIAADSYQINAEEARLLTAMLSDREQEDRARSTEVDRLFLGRDPLLNEEVMVSIFQMPRTQWKVAVVTPHSGLFAMADSVTRKVALWVVAIELCALLVMFSVLRRVFIRPIVKLASDVREGGGDPGTDRPPRRLDDSPQHELGLLAHEFNRRTDNLVAAHTRLTEANRKLQEEMAERLKAAEEKAALEDQLRQARKLESIGTLAGGVAHDFNNLLSPIIAYAEMTLLDLPEDSEHRDALNQILVAAGRAENLVKQLLAFARKQVLEMKTVDLAVIVAEFEKILLRAIREDIELKVILPEDPALIVADRTQIEQVLMNLVVNARDAMPTGGKIILEVSEVLLDADYAREHTAIEPGPHVQLAVSDTGVGMDDATVEKMFEPFFTTKEMGKGTGLGLATIHGVVQQHKGSIWVYSEPGKGTTFKVFLPRATETMATDQAVIERPATVRDGATVMVVEDYAQVRESVKLILEKEGLHVLAAEDPEACLSMIEQFDGEIDLLLTDVVLPKMNGRELFQDVSALRPDVKVVYMSGYADNVIMHHGVLDKGVEFVQKPISRAALLKKVWEVLGG